MSTRTWARMVGGQPLATTYAYNNAGELQSADYSDGTPDVTYAYDRQGRPAQITGATTNDLVFTAAGLLLSENVVNKSWNYASQNRIGYDALQRRSGLTNLSLGLTHTYAYDAASRLQSVSTLDSGAASLISYSYVSNSPLVGGITFQQGGTTRLTTSRSYDNLNRLRQINSVTNAQAVASFAYAYNAANQRTAVTNVDGSRWSYGYDQLGQVTNGTRFWSDGSRVAGQQFGFGFDTIGNRLWATTGGDTNGANLRTQTYSANALNQYTNRTVPGYVEASGSVDAGAAVTVNSLTPDRQGEYYRQEVSINNSASGVAQWISSRATNATGTSVVARLSFTPQTPEASTYDADGNLTQDGLWNYSWDAENRLTRIETRTNAITDSSYWQRVDSTYDFGSRRVRKQVYVWNPAASAYQLSAGMRYFYQGWNLIGQLDEVTGTRLSFIWGTDLSGSMQGAGGVGGLKAMIIHNGSLAGTYFYSYDGNGNVAALISAADGSEAAHYEYGPFAELIRATGPLAKLNPFRFSTKYQDEETDLLYYGYRYLSTVTGRWISRDPIAEGGGQNINAFVKNAPTGFIDRWGLDVTSDWLISGPEKIFALDKRLPTSQLTTYYYLGQGEPCWSADGAVRLQGSVSPRERKASVYPIFLSAEKEDSSISVIVSGVRHTKKITVTYPATVRKLFVRTESGGMFPIYQWKWLFNYLVSDQFGDPIPDGIRISETVRLTAQKGLWGTSPRTGVADTGVSGVPGMFGDTHKWDFDKTSGYAESEQTITIGNWTAKMDERNDANGGWSGDIKASFE